MALAAFEGLLRAAARHVSRGKWHFVCFLTFMDRNRDVGKELSKVGGGSCKEFILKTVLKKHIEK